MLTVRSVWAMPEWKLRLLALIAQLRIGTSKRWRNRRPGLREGFFCALRNFAQVVVMPPMSLNRNFGILFSSWGWLRAVDDHVDGETPLPSETSLYDYLEQKGFLLRACATAGLIGDEELEAEDILLLHALRGALARGYDLLPEFALQIEWFWFDAKRKGVFALTNKKTLDTYAYSLEIGIVRLITKVLGGNLEITEEVIAAQRGILQRIDWLTDTPDDISKGFINIPAEDIVHFVIDRRSLIQVHTWEQLRAIRGFTSWHRSEVRRLNNEWRIVESRLKPSISAMIPTLWARILLSMWVKKQREELDVQVGYYS